MRQEIVFLPRSVENIPVVPGPASHYLRGTRIFLVETAVWLSIMVKAQPTHDHCRKRQDSGWSTGI